jgi:hypothetical protein
MTIKRILGIGAISLLAARCSLSLLISFLMSPKASKRRGARIRLSGLRILKHLRSEVSASPNPSCL